MRGQALVDEVHGRLVVGGLGAFVAQIRTIVKRRLPRPPALPRRDWSTWQTHVAFLWLLVATVLGVILSVGLGGESALTLMWIYGVAGLVGFLAQIVTGMQGRLVPFYAWYRAFEAKLLAAIHLRFGLPAELPDRVTKLIKRADKIAAYYEATGLAGFSRAEARRFFGQPRGLSSALVNRLSHLSPLPAAAGETEFLKRFKELHR